MKKDILKGMVIGCLVTLVISSSIPAFAYALGASIEFNLIRIKDEEMTIVNWGQDYVINEKRKVPSSIIYNDEIYLQIDLVSNVFGGRVLWNGDSSTVTLIDDMQSDYIKSMVKKDAHGNEWVYTIEKYDKATYLTIWDENRGYARAYKLAGEKAYEFTEERVWFASITTFPRPKNTEEYMNGINMQLSLINIHYDNNPDTQDGIEYIVETIKHNNRNFESFSDFIISDGYLFYFYNGISSGSIRAIPCLDDDQPKNVGSVLYNGSTNIQIKEIKDEYLYFTDFYRKNPNIETITCAEFKIKIDGTEDAIMLRETKTWDVKLQ